MTVRTTLALALLLAFTGCASRPPRQEAPPLAPLTVPVARVQRRTVVRDLRLPADVRAWQQARIYAKVAGYLQEVLVDKGDRVRAGQLLARLRVPEMEREAAGAEAASARDQAGEAAARAQLPRLEAEGEAARADFERARALQARARAGVTAAEAAATQARAEVKLDEATYRRLKGVYDEDSGLLARQDLDEAGTRLEVARGKAAAARQDVSAARQAVAAAGDGVQAARSRMDAQTRQIRVAEDDARRSGYQYQASRQAALQAAAVLSYTQIRAPFAGLVTRRWLDPGALAQSAATNAQGQTRPILALADFNAVRVMIRIPELEAPHVQRGTPVEVQSEALPGRIFRGRVTRTSGVLDDGTRTLLAEVDLANADHALRPGMYVAATLALQAHRGALAVPADAVLAEKQRRFVFVIEKGRARKVTVVTGFENARWVEIRRGLRGGEEIAAGAVRALTDGAPVAPAPQSRARRT